MIEKIQQYWDERAVISGGTRSATTDDVHLRDLEVATIVGILGTHLTNVSESTVLDVGCGDGDTTLRIAKDLPGARIHGIDYSPKMISIAKERLRNSEAKDRVTFEVADATQLAQARARYAAVITCRVLINLPTEAMQFDVLRQFARLLTPGGVYVGTENFTDGQNNLNAGRKTMGLEEIPVRWHNLFFDRTRLLSAMTDEFAEIRIEDFASSYYFATRIVYSAMCKARGEKPDYDHDIHRLAPSLPPIGRFSPVQLIIARRGSSSHG